MTQDASRTNQFSGLDLLSTAVVLVDDKLIVQYLNAGAENLFGVSARRRGITWANLPPAHVWVFTRRAQ